MYVYGKEQYIEGVVYERTRVVLSVMYLFALAFVTPHAHHSAVGVFGEQLADVTFDVFDVAELCWWELGRFLDAPMGKV